MPSGLFCLTFLDRLTSYVEGVWLDFIITMFCRICFLNANNVDPRSAASDLGSTLFANVPFIGINGLIP